MASLGTLIGVPHTSIRFWDLRYFYDTRSFLQLPFPDLIAVNGPHAKRMFLESGYKDYQLVEVEALRYMYLSSYSSTQHLSNNSSPSRPIQLLVLGDYLPKHNQSMLNLLSSLSSDILANLSITIKTHPACSIKSFSIS